MEPTIVKQKTAARVEQNADLEYDSNVTPVHKRPMQQIEDDMPSDAVLGRAEAIANIAENNSNVVEDNNEVAPDEADTTPLPRKRHGWIWIIVVVILLGIAAAVYLNWDFVYGKVSSIIQ